MVDVDPERPRSRRCVFPKPWSIKLWGACYHRLLLTDQPITLEFVDALLDNVFGGITR